MALEIDGAAVLGAILARPDLFCDIRGDLAKVARGLVVKQIKGRQTTIENLQAVRESVGSDAFALIVDGLTDADVRTLAARFDGGHAERSTATSEWLRQHLIALASAASTPTATKAAARRAPPPAPDGRSLRHESVLATPERKSKI